MGIEELSLGVNTTWVVLTAAMILLMEGGFELLGIQFIGLVALSTRGFLATWFGLKAIALLVPLRSTEEEEEVGLDISYHGIIAANQSHEFIEYYNQYEQTEQK